VDEYTGIVFANTQTRSGTLVIPDTYTLPGRVITFKDSVGTFQVSSLSLVSQPGQTIDNNLASSVQSTRFGWTTLTGGPSNSWFVTGGTVLNSITTNSTVVDYISTASLFQTNIVVSTLVFRDQILSTNNRLTNFGSLLYYSTPTATTVVAGGYRQSFGSLFLRVRS
jgi:hypothetical protein